MRRIRYGITAGAFFSLALLAVAFIGCGSNKDNYDQPARPRGTGGSGGTLVVKKKLQPVKGTYDGVISGKVVWKGEKIAPAPEPFMTDPKQQDASYCKQGSAYETAVQTIWIGDNGNLGNVFVWIEPEEGHYFDVPKEQLKPFAQGGKQNIVEISQPHCAFLPHCTVLFPSYYKDGKQVATAQQLKIVNNATISHTAKVDSQAGNILNATLPAGDKSLLEVPPDEQAITLSCGTHGWMKAYLRSFDHPYAAVTRVGANFEKKVYQDKKDPSFGTFEIKGVPVGAKVTLKVWHEKLGLLETKQITLGKTNPLDFVAPK